jgi:long-chain acyl-CoA synthetase
VALDQVQQLDPSIVCAHPRVILSLYRQHLARGGPPRSRFFGPSLRLLRTAGWNIDPELQHMLAAQGIDVGEWYGASETSLVAMTPPGGWRAGELGPVCPGAELRLGPDGEMLVRSPLQMMGYYGDAALTREKLTVDGFVRTGDFGELGPDGALRLVGRKTEIANMLDGTNVAVAPIEDLILALPWVEQVVVVGTARPYLAALIAVRDPTPSSEPDGFLGERASPALYDRARRDLAAVNARRESVAQVRAFALFGRRFDAQLYAELKLSGKIRCNRAGIDAAYRARIEALYSPA